MDELTSRARSLLEAASLGDDPTVEDARRVRHAVLLRVGAVGIGTAALATSTAQAKGLIGSLAAKVGATLVVVVGGTAAVTYYGTHQEPKQAPVVVAPAPAPKAKAKATPQPLRAESIPELKVEELPVESEEAPKRSAAPRVARAEAAPVETAPQQHLEAEVKLIRAADAALRGGRTSEALSLLGQHAERHPNGLLAQEREGLNLLARCQSGGRAAARPAAERYLARAPRSPLAPRLRSACGIEAK